MKFVRLISLAVKVILFILLLVLAIQNMQSVKVNFLDLYALELPLIIVLAIFLLTGLMLGLGLGYLTRFQLKSKISKLTKELAKYQTEKPHEQQTII